MPKRSKLAEEPGNIKHLFPQLPEKYQPIWRLCAPLLNQGRPDDLEHSRQTGLFIINYKGDLKLDMDILVPTALMHDIGHTAILPEHFKFVTGPHKIKNGKLVHMLSGAKIAKDILDEAGYQASKSKQIIDIISIHDFDQLDLPDARKFYDSENKKIFHDIDALDRYTEVRIKNVSKMYKDRDKLLEILEKQLDLFFYDEFSSLAKKRFTGLI